MSELVDWRVAGVVARTLAGEGSGRRSVRRDDLRKASRGSVRLVREYTGLEPRGRLPSAELIDRSEWIELNLASLRELSARAEAEIEDGAGLPGALGRPLRAAAGIAAGIEMGLASGYLAQRVLGQYDVALIGAERPARLLFIAPNLADAQRQLGAKREPFLRWIALHEATHVVQFSAVPWLRDHIGGLAEQLIAGNFARLDLRALAELARKLAVPDPRRLAQVLRDGDWATPFIGRPRQRLLARLQATMAIVEGYSEHVMDAVGAEQDPAMRELRVRLEKRRGRRNPVGLALSYLFGVEMKTRQYGLGRRFCDEVVGSSGIETLNRVWSQPASMPRPSELERPGRWLARVA